MRILLVTPPMTQLNTPYPATAYLAGFLRSRGYQAEQRDLALALVLRLLSAQGMREVAQVVARHPSRFASAAVAFFHEAADDYVRTVEPVVRFLQGRDPSLAYRITSGTFLPEGPRFASLADDDDEDALGWAFGALGLTDRARHLATLYVEDLADVVAAAVDPRFNFVRYGERLAHSQPTFDPLRDALDGEPTLLDGWLSALAVREVDAVRPDWLALTVPFAGNAYGALRIARAVRTAHPDLPIVMGGGWVNTDLRGLTDPRIFDDVDYITLDAGERPLLNLLEGGPKVRTFSRVAGVVRYDNDPLQPDIPFAETGTPTTDGLPLDRYLGVLDLLNPMHRLWADTRWNKLTVAHGCYWRRCSFCDTSLDYIRRYEAPEAGLLVDRMQALIDETGRTGFHFVDEAAPPRRLKELAQELLERGVTATWWGNVRFEKAFSPEVCELLAESGCVAVTGGLEVASDRLLELMDKGVTVPQVARVTQAFTQAGIMVHAYLMYGFPTQTVQETVDSLEIVRQLFEAGCIQSAFWHRFAATAHSPVGQHPERYGVTLRPMPASTFGYNDVDFDDPTGIDHDALGVGLDRALYNYLHGIGLDQPVHTWFEGLDVHETTVEADYIEGALASA